MARYLTLLTIAVVALGIGVHAWAGAASEQQEGPSRGFQGYWMGVDPVDGVMERVYQDQAVVAD